MPRLTEYLENTIVDLTSEIDNNTANVQRLNKRKVEKAFLGWVQYADDQYTSGIPLNLVTGARTVLENNGANVVNTAAPSGSTDWLVANKFMPDNELDTYRVRVRFNVNPTLNNRNLTLELDIGGAVGTIWTRTIRLARGATVVTAVTEDLDFYTSETFLTNGGTFYLTCDGEAGVFDIVYKIERVYRHAPADELALPADALVALTPESAYTTTGSAALIGESVEQWRNIISGSTAPFAEQTDINRQPVIEEAGGRRQIRFQGNGDFLDFGIVGDLNFPQPATDYTIIAICGTGANTGDWLGNISGSLGQMGLSFKSGRLFFHDGRVFKNYTEAPPIDETMITLQRDNTNDKTIVYQNLTERLNETSAVTVGTSTRDFLIGAVNNNDAESMDGSLRYFFVWKRLLTEVEIKSVYDQTIGV
ncbi:hypothetical protein [Aquimarina algiphila]|uniref:Uncharacterized protein n=1 Tax=Aquimarina algiphila TaxID=2047982 RepID=A0A554VRK4_9FLAO|nr:hypothetical protein [Aquimarina algiphila]TSE11294.1 hypothetical protein FOF46_01300 [Aquimarina algiphila]